jgi:hypothetical protein
VGGRYESESPYGGRGKDADPPDFPLAAVSAHPALEANEEPVVPRRVVPNILRQQLLDILELSVPELLRLLRLFGRREGRVGEGAGRVEVAQDPLSVRPGVVVLGVEGEGFRGEVALSRRVFECEDDVAAVLPASVACKEIVNYRATSTVMLSSPDLVRLEVVLDELVEEVELFRQVRLEFEERVGPVFPAQLRSRQSQA